MIQFYIFQCKIQFNMLRVEIQFCCVLLSFQQVMHSNLLVLTFACNNCEPWEHIFECKPTVFLTGAIVIKPLSMTREFIVTFNIEYGYLLIVPVPSSMLTVSLCMWTFNNSYKFEKTE